MLACKERDIDDGCEGFFAFFLEVDGLAAFNVLAAAAFLGGIAVMCGEESSKECWCSLFGKGKSSKVGKFMRQSSPS